VEVGNERISKNSSSLKAWGCCEGLLPMESDQLSLWSFLF
jgi:hypothetical protein